MLMVVLMLREVSGRERGLMGGGLMRMVLCLHQVSQDPRLGGRLDRVPEVHTTNEPVVEWGWLQGGGPMTGMKC